mmetsp:Transcript_40942/g.60235  ORF Transcript_40942/g.60235 Transcript_40942/m.60235 type:complete len:371 (-) Transcript_40942:305-1417(-)|eukprot:CAMPEP_0173078360 /NCGR_PEP_ID=MMETSP1102-20130122/14055_1 /TAXON_ID=49646 /ORGANISM="Geminigera sp., Strain Caron Lab Isolate" /LENGTH=370 /DNA_ID=CAMNT_0013949583 /DNA_START=75 /DNA_END=1187 /DNA_ORIENTATION=+
MATNIKRVITSFIPIVLLLFSSSCFLEIMRTKRVLRLLEQRTKKLVDSNERLESQQRRLEFTTPNVSTPLCSKRTSGLQVSSPCMIKDVKYACTSVPNFTLRKMDAVAPRLECLGGDFSWGTCTSGKFLCRHDSICKISTKQHLPRVGFQQCAVSIVNRFIFIHVPKAGGSSMHAFLRGALCSSAHMQAVCDPGILKFDTCHTALSQHADFFVFSFVRHPFSRAISAYIMAIGWQFMKDDVLMSFEEWAQDPDLLHTRLMAMHWMPMHNFLFTTEGCAVADFVGRQESFAEDLYTALLHIGNKKLLEHLHTHGLPHNNTAKSHHSKSVGIHITDPQRIASGLSMSSRDVLFQRYRADFAKFGFRKDDWDA